MSFLRDNLQKKAAEAMKAAEDILPPWAKKHEKAKTALTIIKKLRKDKLAYIDKHANKSAYTINKNFQIIPAEVGRLVGGDAKNTLYKAPYSVDLIKHIEEVNEGILKRKEERLKADNQGIRDKKKVEVFGEYQKEKNRADNLESQLKLSQIKNVLNKMPLKTKIALGLID